MTEPTCKDCLHIEAKPSIGDRIFKLLQKCQRNIHKPDLHSFVAQIDDGTVFVECRGYDVVIDSITYDKDGVEHRTTWAGTTVAAANRLEMLNMDLLSIEM